MFIPIHKTPSPYHLGDVQTWDTFPGFFPFLLGVIYRLQHGFVQLQISTRNGALFTPFPGSTKCDAWYGVQATMDHFVEMYDVGFQRRQLSVGFLFLFAAI